MTVPLPLAAAGFAAGILAGSTVSLRPHLGAAAFSAGAALVAAGLGRGRHRRSSSLLAATTPRWSPQPRTHREHVLAAAGFGVRRRDPETARPVRRFGWVLVGALLAGMGWHALRTSTPTVPSVEGNFRVVAASDVRTWDWGWGIEVRVRRHVAGRDLGLSAWASDEGKPPAVEAGDRLMVEGRLEGLRPEGFDASLRARGIEARMPLRSVRVLGPTSNPLLRLANLARTGLRAGASRSIDRVEAELLLGLAIGETDRMDPEVDEDFRASGLGHLLAVSGSNVAMFLAPLLAFGARVGLRVRGTVLLGLAGVVLFALITRWEPSVLRASAMAGMALAAAWAGRPRSTGQTLSAAVLALLLADPSLASSLAFQLSVAATVGLAAMAAPLAARLRWLPRWVALAVAATLAAQAAVTPLLLLHFGVVPTVTVLANVLAFPAVPPALFLGIAASTAAALSSPLGRMLGDLAEVPLGYLVAVADRTARFTLPSVTSAGPVMPVVIGLGVALLAVALRRSRPGRLGAVSVTVAVGVAAWAVVPTAGPPAGLTVTFLDVGQGDGAVVRGPDGETILIDGGPEERTVVADLARLGVRRIDLAVASHGHADHVEGFPAVLARFPVSLLVEPGCPAESPAFREMLAAARDEDVPVRHPRGGDRFDVGTLRIDVLGPDECSPDEPNDDSLVLRISLGPASVLFPGDAEVPAQDDLLADGDPVRADVLKVPHHGGDTSAAAFFEAVDARVAVVSTGQNDYGHPTHAVLEALRRAGMVVYRTDRHGDVTVSFGAGDEVIVGSER